MIKDTSQQDTVLVSHQRGWLKKILWSLAVVVLIGVVWQTLASWQNNELSVARAQIKLAKVERGDLLRDIVASGKIVAANAPIVYSPEAGLVTLMVKPGDLVVKGQTVATIESPQLMALLSQQKTIVQQMTADVSREKLAAKQTHLTLQQKSELAKVNLAAAEREARRATLSMKKNIISQLDFEKAQDELARAKLIAHHAKQEAALATETLAFEVENKVLELKTKQQELTEIQRKVNGLAINSPVAGIVGNWLVEQKAKVNGNQSLMMIVDLSVYQAELQVPESYANELGLGMQVEVTLGDSKLIGKLISISPEIKDNQVIARVRMDETKNINLRQNQRISARIILEQKNNVLMIRRGQFYQSGAGKVAYQVHGDIAQQIAIVSGATSMSEIEILNGAKEGDTLVTSDLDVFANKKQVLLY